jgi:hypothetical protein
MLKMKKLMVLCMVLGLVGIANAGVIDITITSLNGVPITPTKEITISPTDVIDFQIMFNAPTTEYCFAIGAQINVVGPGTLDWSEFVGRTWDPDEEMWVIGPDVTTGYDPELAANGADWVVIGAAARGKKGTGADIWIIKNILLHCDRPGDVLVYLTNYALSPSSVIDIDYQPVDWSYGAGIVIHQLIPEPMTLTLLGLGSLFLARRKK